MKIFEVIHTPTLLIQQNCTKITNSGVQLFRGADKPPHDFEGIIRTDRFARDSTSLQVAMFDTIMEANGWPHRKSNTLSTSTNIEQAADFGTSIFQIYPYDDASYVYSTEYGDFLDPIRQVANTFLRKTNFAYDLDHWPDHIGAARIELNRQFEKGDMTVLNYIRENIKSVNDITRFIFTRNPVQMINAAAGEVLVCGSSYVAVFNKRNIDEPDSSEWIDD